MTCFTLRKHYSRKIDIFEITDCTQTLEPHLRAALVHAVCVSICVIRVLDTSCNRCIDEVEGDELPRCYSRRSLTFMNLCWLPGEIKDLVSGTAMAACTRRIMLDRKITAASCKANTRGINCAR